VHTQQEQQAAVSGLRFDTGNECEIQLYIFERKILRKIYGPTQNPDGTRRIKTNDKLRHRMKQEHIKFIKYPG